MTGGQHCIDTTGPQMTFQVDHCGVVSSSPKDNLYLERMHELLGSVSNLEMQLKMETQQKEEAMAKAETLGNRVAELEQQQQLEQQQLVEAQQMQKASPSEETAKIETQLDNEKVQMLEFRVADLEKQLEDQSHTQNESNEQVSCVFTHLLQTKY